MRIVIIADGAFVRREREMLSRLEIGLADEGVRVVHAVPIELVGEASNALYSTVVGYESKGLGITRGVRAARLADAIRDQTDAPSRQVDVVHSFGGGFDFLLAAGSRFGPAGLSFASHAGAWGMGLELARLCSASLMVELWDAAMVPAAAHLANRRLGVRPIEFSVPEPGLRRALRRRSPNSSVHVAAWGVHAPPSVPEFDDPGSTPDTRRPLAIALLAEGKDPASVRASVEALSILRQRGLEFMLFAGNSQGKHGRDSVVWAAARQFGLIDHLSLVPDMEARREPILEMDMLLLPESAGRQRTLILDAMVQGVLVVAARDELVECLMGEATEGVGPTAVLVAQPRTPDWVSAIESMLNIEPPARVIPELSDKARRLRVSAHQAIRSTRSASGHVAAVLTAYHTLVAASQVGVKM